MTSAGRAGVASRRDSRAVPVPSAHRPSRVPAGRVRGCVASRSAPPRSTTRPRRVRRSIRSTRCTTCSWRSACSRPSQVNGVSAMRSPTACIGALNNGPSSAGASCGTCFAASRSTSRAVRRNVVSLPPVTPTLRGPLQIADSRDSADGAALPLGDDRSHAGIGGDRVAGAQLQRGELPRRGLRAGMRLHRASCAARRWRRHGRGRWCHRPRRPTTAARTPAGASRGCSHETAPCNGHILRGKMKWLPRNGRSVGAPRRGVLPGAGGVDDHRGIDLARAAIDAIDAGARGRAR